MNLKSLLDDAMEKGEKLKNEILTEVFQNKTIQQLVSNKNFLKALAKVIQTKDEVKKVIQSQVKNIFNVMDVPRRDEILSIAKKITNMEKTVDKIGRKSIAVKVLPKSKKTKKKSPAVKKAATKKSKPAAKKTTRKKASPAKKKSTARKTTRKKTTRSKKK